VNERKGSFVDRAGEREKDGAGLASTGREGKKKKRPLPDEARKKGKEKSIDILPGGGPSWLVKNPKKSPGVSGNRGGGKNF